MADEATTTVFGLVKQLVEGHQWINRHLNTLPTSAWSIDAFGHGSTMPYLLKQSGITGMMIQVGLLKTCHFQHVTKVILTFYAVLAES